MLPNATFQTHLIVLPSQWTPGSLTASLLSGWPVCVQSKSLIFIPATVLLIALSSVRTIENVLNSLSPRPLYVQVSTSTKCITVGHSADLHPQTIQAALSNAGFDVVSRSKSTPPSGRTSIASSVKKKRLPRPVTREPNPTSS